LKAGVPSVTMAVLFTVGLERLHEQTVLGVLILTVGTVMAAYGEIQFKWVGVIMMFTSEFCEALRMAVLQYLMGSLRYDLVEGLYVMAPASLMFLTIGIVIFEYGDLAREDGIAKIFASPLKYMLAAFLGFLVNFLTLGVIKSTSSLTFKVVGQTKNTVVILLSVVVFGSEMTSIQVCGYSLSIVGFIIYQRGKMIQAKEDAAMSADRKS